MRIVLAGYYGFENTGDEALLEVLIKTFQQKHPDHKFTVLSNAPEKTAAKFQVSAISRYNLWAVREALKTSDLFISGPGGLLQDRTSTRSLFYYLGLMLLAKFYGKPVVLFAAGVGPLLKSSSRFLCKKLLSQADLLLLRDHSSYLLAKTLLPQHPKIFETGDLGSLFRETEPAITEILLKNEGIQTSAAPLIGISVRPLPSHATRRAAFYRSLAEGLDLLHKELNANLLFLLFQCPDDIDATSRVIDHLKSPYKVIFKELSPKQIAGVIAQTDLFIGMRLHSLVFAANAAVPSLGLAYDPKVAAFMQSLGLPLLNLKDLLSEKLLTLTKNLWENRSSLQEKIKIKTEKSRAQALLNFSLFDKLVAQDQVQNVLGINIHNLTPEELLERVSAMVSSNLPHYLTTPNPEIIVQSQIDPQLMQTVNQASLNLADGAGLVVLSRFIGKPLKGRLSGIDALYLISDLAAKKGWGVFLLGGSPGVAEAAAANLKKLYPGIQIKGTHHGYFTEQEEPQIISLVKEAKPAILFVGIGAPKQEKWLAKHYQDLGVPIALTVGGSLDVVAGAKKRAPQWVQNLNLEWVYRLLSEPTRWKRQIALLQFMLLIWDEMWRIRKEKQNGKRPKRDHGSGTSRNQLI